MCPNCGTIERIYNESKTTKIIKGFFSLVFIGWWLLILISIKELFNAVFYPNKEIDNTSKVIICKTCGHKRTVKVTNPHY